MARIIETSIDIAASPAAVWEILTDFSAMPSWNPFMPAISGALVPGARLDVTIAPPGGQKMRFRPTVQAAETARELRWLGRVLLPGLLDGEHWFRLSAAGDGRTRLDHGEHFSGLLTPLLGQGLLDKTRAGFESMNQALKARAEG